MIIDTVEELFSCFNCYFKEIGYFDELNNIQDCLYFDNIEEMRKTYDDFVDEYGDRELVDFEFTNDETNHIFVHFR